MSRRSRFHFFIGLLVLGVCAGTVNATIHVINLSNFSISPQNTAVLLGDTVRWTIVNGVHTTTSDGTSPKQWDSGTMSGGGTSFDLIIDVTDSTGDYPYTCQVHPIQMIDTLRVSAPVVACCVAPIRGNVNGSVNEAPTVADLTYLVQFLFNSGNPPPCNFEANVNASVNGMGQQTITVADLTYLVQFLFNGGIAPQPCP